MAKGKPIGTVFVELDLDATKYTSAQKKILAESKVTSLSVERNFSILGTKSDQMYQAMRDRVINAFDMIKNSGKASAAEIIRAEQAKAAKVKEIDEVQFGKRLSLIDQMKTNWIAATVAIAAAYATIQKAWNLAEAAANYEEAMTSLDAMTRQYGTNAEDMVATVQKQSHGLIGVAAAARISGDAIMKGLSPDKLAQIAAWSVSIEHLKGGTVKAADAFEMLTQSIATGRERGLKQLVGIVDLEEKYGKYADTMSKAEKAAAMYAIAAERMAQVQKVLGPDIDSTADKMQRFLNQIEALKLTLGDFIIRAGAGLMATFQSVAALALGLARVVMAPIQALMMATDYLGITKGKAEEYKRDMEALADAGMDLAERANENFKLMRQGRTGAAAGGTGSIGGDDTDGSRKRFEKLEEIYRKYLEERDALGVAETERELVRLDYWYNEERKKLQDLHAADKYYSALNETYTAKHQEIRRKNLNIFSEFYIAEQKRMTDEAAKAEQARIDEEYARLESAAKIRIDREQSDARMLGATERELIQLRADGEVEILELRQQRLLQYDEEATAIDEINRRMKEYWDLERQIAEVREKAKTKTKEEGYKSDASAQIGAWDNGLGAQQAALNEASAQVEAYKSVWFEANKTIGQSAIEVGMSLRDGLVSTLRDVIMGVKTAADAFRELAKAIVGMIVEAFLKWVVNRMIMAAMGKAFQAAEMAASVAMGAATAAAWAPAAAMVSLATFGANAPPAMAGLTATAALAQTLALPVPKLAEGGIVKATPGGRIVRVAEGGKDEAIVPLDEGIGGGQTIQLILDGQVLAEWFDKKAKRYGFVRLVPA